MAYPWATAIRRTGQLLVYLGAVPSGWSTVIREAVENFNALSKKYSLGVVLAESDKPPNVKGGANVSVQTANGAISYRFEDIVLKDSLSGAILHGRTKLIARDGFNEQAAVFLPQNPQISTPNALRPVGPAVKKIIAIHELIHACGLTDAEHRSDDVFNGNPNVEAGDTATGDRVVITVAGKKHAMPPPLLSGPTANTIRRLWGA